MDFLVPGREAQDAIRRAVIARRAVSRDGLELLVQTPEAGLLVHLRKPVQPTDQLIMAGGGFVVVRRDGSEIAVINAPQVRPDMVEMLQKAGYLSPEQAEDLIHGILFAKTNPHTVPQAVPVESAGNFRAWAFHDVLGKQIGSLTLDYAGGVGALLTEERNSRGRVVGREIYDLRVPNGRLGRQAMYELAQLVQGEGIRDSPYLRPEERAKLGDMRAAASLREVLELIEMFGMLGNHHREQDSPVEALKEAWQVMSADVRADRPTVLLGNVRGHEVPLQIETSVAPAYLPDKNILTFVGTVRYVVPGVGLREYHGGFHLILPKSRDTVVLVTADNRGIASDVAVK